MHYFWFILTFLIIISTLFLTIPFFKIKKNKTSKDYVVIVTLLIGFISIVLSLYFHWGNYDKVSQWYAMKDRAVQVKAAMQQYGSRQKIIEALKKKLETLPNTKESARGWYLLGKLYLGNQQVELGIAALGKAFSLDPNNPEIILAFVSTKYFITHELDNFARELLLKIANNSAYKASVLNLLGTNAYQHKNYDEAIRYWEELLQLIPAESEDNKVLLTTIANAQRLRAQTTDSGQRKNGLIITVDVSKKIQSQIKQSDTLFIYALSIQGPKMPLAVKKLAMQKFPITVTLDDNDAMLENHTLSQATEIKVEARISRTGNAIPSAGDWVGNVIVHDVTKNKLKLLINSKI